MDDLDRLCARLSRQRRLERVLARVLPHAAVAGLVGATTLAVVRLAVPDAGWLAPAIAAAAALAPLAGIPAALRRRDPPWLLAGHIDRLAGTDGLAMALAASPERNQDWIARIAPRLRTVQLPALRLPRLASALAAAALLAGAWYLPQVSAPPPAPPVAGASMAGVESGLKRLADEGLATPPAIEALEERLAAVREAMAAQGLNQQTWAALDALQRDVDATSAVAADRLADALAKADALAGLSATGDAAAQAAGDLAAALAELQAQAPGLAAKLPGGAEGEALLRLAQQALAGGELTEAQRQALQRWGLDPAKQPAGGAQPGDAAAAKRLADRLATELAQRAGMHGPPEADGDGPGGGPGPGGGHAALTWGDIQRVEGGFRERLEAGTPHNPESGAAIGTQARAPTADEQTMAAAERAALAAQAAAAADARRSTIAPRHRSAVAGYFAAGPTP
jgi:hypothetical protein